MCWKCPPSTETHAGWSHLIWHNFVKVAFNWIKICNLTYVGMHNRHIKFGSKFPTVWEKLLQVVRGDCFTHRPTVYSHFLTSLFFSRRMMPWQFCDDSSNVSGVITLTDRRTDKQAKSQTDTTDNNSTLAARVITKAKSQDQNYRTRQQDQRWQHLTAK